VKVEWHVPSDAETAFVLEILDKVVQPSLDTLNKLLEVAPKDRDNIWRNDFCRYVVSIVARYERRLNSPLRRRLHLVRSSWSSLSTFYLEQPKTVVNSHLDACEIEELTARSLDVKAGFTLTDPSDPRYQSVVAHRARFADFLHRASVSLQQSGGEDHIDAVMSVTKGIDVYLLEYGMSRGSYQALKKNHNTVKDLSRMWATQKEFPRPLWVERAQLYHSSRVHMHALLRRRSATDDQLLEDLVEFSLSPYTRVRK
jgi:proteasome activator subunit 4